MWQCQTLGGLCRAKQILTPVCRHSSSDVCLNKLFLPSRCKQLYLWHKFHQISSSAVVQHHQGINLKFSKQVEIFNQRFFGSQKKGADNVHDMDIELEQGQDVSVSNLEKGFDANLTNAERAECIFEAMVTEKTLQKREYDVLDVITILVDAGFHKSVIASAVKNYPHLFRKHTVKQWAEALKTLKDCGFSNKDIITIITRNRNVFHCAAVDLFQVTYALRQVFVTEQRMRKICVALPILMTLPLPEIEEQFSRLTEIFPKNDLYRLLDNTPTLFLSEIELTLEKLNYVQTKLNIPEKYIVNTCLFGHSMEHIITRSEFLILSGLYKKPDKHGHSPVENAKLRDIIDSSEKDFCRRVAGCTQREFRAFCEMFDMFDTRSEHCVELKPERFQKAFELESLQEEYDDKVEEEEEEEEESDSE